MLLNIKEYTQNKKENLKKIITDTKAHPSLAIIQVGNVEASNRYIKNKIKDCEEVGIKATLYKFEEATTTEQLCEFIPTLHEHGIIVQLPLPKHINNKRIINVIPLDKDVDGFKYNSGYYPCTPKGIIDYLTACNFEFESKHAVVLGRSAIVGKPIRDMLLDKNCTVSVCHSKTNTRTRSYLLQNADLVISAVGQRGIIKSIDAPNAIIIDVGINFNNDGKLCGDVIIEAGDENRVTPVPGGVGLLTRLALLTNTFDACVRQRGK